MVAAQTEGLKLKPRVVFDTNVVVSALLFRGGHLAALRPLWQDACTPLLSKATVEELSSVLAYTKFNLTAADIAEVLALYLPHAEIVSRVRACRLICRDASDQPFLDLAQSAKADTLVTGDRDVLALKAQARFAIVQPAEFLAMF